MTIAVGNVFVANNTFEDWVVKTNLLATAMSDSVVTVNSNAATGNAIVNGTIQSTTLFVNAISGGTIGSPGLLTFSTNTTLAGDVVTISSNVVSSAANLALGLAANVQIIGANATHGVLFANNTTNKLFFGQVSIFNIANVAIDTPANGQILTYNSANGTFYNANNTTLSGTAVLAGNGLTGGGALSSNVTLTVGSGNGITVNSTATAVSPGNSQLIANTTGLWANQGAFNHNALGNYNANQHTDHSTIYIKGGTGLAGNAAITANVTINMNVESLTTNATPTQSSTYVPAWNGTTHVKIPLNKIGIGVQHISINSRAMISRPTNGPSLGLFETANNQVVVPTLDFSTSTTEYAQFSMLMPDNWNEGNVTAQFGWSHANTATNFGVSWGIRAVAFGDGDQLDAAFGSNSVVSDLGSADFNEFLRTAESPSFAVAGGPSAGEWVTFEVFRQTANTNDNLAVDARLHSVKIFLTTDTNIGG